MRPAPTNITKNDQANYAQIMASTRVTVIALIAGSCFSGEGMRDRTGDPLRWRRLHYGCRRWLTLFIGGANRRSHATTIDWLPIPEPE